MSPALRSSAPSTPTANSPNTTPVRKQPQCTKCKRPRAGHPRQGCPFADLPLSLTPPDSDPGITNALESMHIQSRPEAPQKNYTLDSLSTESSAIVAQLLQPGMLDRDSMDQERIQRWQETVVTPTKGKSAVRTKEEGISVRSPMPGTLRTPWTSFNTQPLDNVSRKAEYPTLALGDIAEYQSTQPLSQDGSTTATARRQSLALSMSMEERSLFLADLTSTIGAPLATVYVLPALEIPAIRSAAAKVGLSSQVVVGKHSNDTRLILGKDDRAVQALFDDLDRRTEEKNGGKLRAAAGGAVVGAMATFTGLALA